MKKEGCAAILLIVFVAILVSIVITAGFVAIACWAFGLTFSWKMAIGIYAVICLLSMIFGGVSS